MNHGSGTSIRPLNPGSLDLSYPVLWSTGHGRLDSLAVIIYVRPSEDTVGEKPHASAQNVVFTSLIYVWNNRWRDHVAPTSSTQLCITEATMGSDTLLGCLATAQGSNSLVWNTAKDGCFLCSPHPLSWSTSRGPARDDQQGSDSVTPNYLFFSLLILWLS